ncbi:MAG TPA: TIGR00725 family protein [Elusimicrobia bacterium]|nr:TIGR00725 family protein [Elusimicrobiota bacterium]
MGVIGGSEVAENAAKLAEEVGRRIAEKGYILVCGGMSGVMEFVCKGAKSADGLTIGILPGKDKSEGNPYIDIPIVTAMSHARNAIIVRTADVLIAIGGKYGTLSEIALAKVINKQVIGLGSWNIPGVIKVKTVEEAIEEVEKEVRKLE